MLELKDVSKAYGDGDQKQLVLSQMNWSFEVGKFTALMGKSGSGKSTVLNLLSGLDQPDQGQVIFFGQNLYARSDASLSDMRLTNFGYIFQSFNLISNLTTYENIEYPLYLMNIKSAERKEKTLKMAEELGLMSFRDKLPSQLSGGQRQRVAIGRALVKKPKYIFADEPTANLDEQTGAEIISLIQKMQKQHGTTVVYVTHDLDIVNIADTCLYLTNRKIENYDRTRHSY
ncbi:MAG: ABC transporter ATP-binding protein [Bdellovibrionaceae bacterium]|nr:ABC transporter ATP-binding protein [Pseudobdellovibrionaceae bacterium]